VGRLGHTASLLPDGKVLVVAGQVGGVAVEASAELYDPNTGEWSFTDPLPIARDLHTAIELRGGNILVVGGGNGSVPLDSCFTYDARTANWLRTGDMSIPRALVALAELPNGNVLGVAGLQTSTGFHTPLVEEYDPTSRVWSTTKPSSYAYHWGTLTTLRNGLVLAAGGVTDMQNTGVIPFAETFDACVPAWTDADSMHVARAFHTATLLGDGTVLVAGGSSDGGFTGLKSAELY
jgi:hypothetical protein